MKDIVPDKNLIAYCGLYCGACRQYLHEKCQGCHQNAKATWCKIRSCNIENNYQSCADCTQFANPKDCKKFNNFMSKFFALVFRSDRAGCVAAIKNMDYENYSIMMAENKMQTIKK